MNWVRIVLAGWLLVGCGAHRSEAELPPGGNVPAFNGEYRLPVRGEWRVHRHHYKHKGDQSSGVDLVKVGSVGDRSRNDGYPSYREPIVADGPGIVAIAVDGNPDNSPPKVNKYDQHGNFVVIDHRNGQFSLFAHFIPGTIRVRAGQVVHAGQELGLCGNSGRTTMPHLHWQMMDGWLAHEARGIPIRMAPYINRGQRTQRRLEQGDVVEAIEP